MIDEERISHIMDGCKVSYAEALVIYKQQLADEALHDRIEILKDKQKEQQMRRQFKKARKIYE